MLEMERVVRHYRSAGEEVRAVDGVSLHVEQGEMVALEGPSGSGKTTLLLLIAALLSPERGVVRYRGRDLAGLSEREAADYLLRDVGFVFQGFHLMARTSAVENASVKLLLEGVDVRQARVRASAWLERVGLGQRLARTPEELSGGERQRVAIARALAGEPGLILADEPTGNLDSARSREIVELLHSIAHERDAAVLLVTHDHAAASLADRRLYLRDGRLVENDPAGAVVDPGLDPGVNPGAKPGVGAGVVAPSESVGVEPSAVPPG
jgi:ABC-type lipoprotein export system ATPase subunit